MSPRAQQEQKPLERFLQAGGVTTRAAVTWPITPEMVRGWCAKRERLLRAGYRRHELPADMEAELARFPADDDQDLWHRFRLLLLLLADKGKRRDTSAEDRQIAARLLVAREPVPVRIGERVVPMTARSYAAMVALFRHEEALRLVGEAMDYLVRRDAEVRAEVQQGRRRWFAGWMERWRLYWLRRQVESEWQVHVRGILANALSEGGRAATPDEAPEWWYEVGEDEVRMLTAIFEAGHRRLMRMSPVQESEGSQDDDGTDANPFGWDGLLRALEARKRLPPMALDDEDFFRVLAAEMMGSNKGDDAAEVEDLFAA